MKHYLSIDQGNSFTKIGVFRDEELVRHYSLSDDEVDAVVSTITEEFIIDAAIFSSVRNYSEDEINKSFPFNQLIFLSSSLPLPIELDYTTATSLGKDRIANAVAASYMFPDDGSLVVDCGTCITYSVLIKKTFKGGAISPGLKMRFQALHHFTAQLPELSPVLELPDLLGKSTAGSIESGAQHAAMLEMRGMIDEFCSKYGLNHVILTGGSMMFFERHLKSPIFARPYLTLLGLNEILRFNLY